jgi:hypothetical protein
MKSAVRKGLGSWVNAEQWVPHYNGAHQSADKNARISMERATKPEAHGSATAAAGSQWNDKGSDDSLAAAGTPGREAVCQLAGSSTR